MEYTQPIGDDPGDPYVDADPQAGIEGSAVPAAAIEHPQREIVEVIEHYGLTPDGGDLTQLRQAIESAVQSGAGAGRVDWFAATSPPAGWLKANGSAVSRSSYSALFTAITFTDATVDTTNGSTTVTMDNTGAVEPGYVIEGDGIPTGTTVASVDDGTTLTLSQAATATAGDITARFLPWGGGDGASTFDLPDLRGEFIRGWDDGRGVDSGRALGTMQSDALANHYHLEGYGSQAGVYPPEHGSESGGTTRQTVEETGGNDGSDHAKTSGPRAADVSVGGAETRPRNVALLACIKY